MIKRIIADIILFLTIFLAPWYVAVGINFIFIVFFRRFWEGLVAAVIFDFLYSVPSSNFYARFGIFTLLFVILIIIAEKIKKNIRV